ncbi:MAG: hypothetical protein GVY36_05240 [Verrucomicrobia bacterium]|jgi:hypothetical protein|nr:hypothetical protein [Verrucomicrobiota bacterium]
MIQLKRLILFLLLCGAQSITIRICVGAKTDFRLNDLITQEEQSIVVGGFMAESGLIIDSSDLETWHQQSTPNGHGLWAICYGAGKYIAAGHAGSILESFDGKSWRVVTELDEERWLFDVIYENGIFVASGISGIYISNDGKAWNRTLENAKAYGLTYGNGLFVAVGYGGRIFTSNDAQNWTPRSSNTTYMLRSVAYGNGVYIAVGGEGRHGLVMSFDGETWFESSSASKAQPMDICFADGQFTLVGGIWDPTARAFVAGSIEYSTDGRNWITHFAYGQSRIDAVSYHNGSWLAVADDSRLIQIGEGGFELEIAEFNSQDGRVSNRARILDLEQVEVPRLIIRNEADQIVLQWQTQEGLFYRLFMSSDLKSWQDTETEIVGSGELQELIFDLPEDTNLFFRLEIHSN